MIRRPLASAAAAILLTALIFGSPAASGAAQRPTVASSCSIDVECVSGRVPLITLPEWPDVSKPVPPPASLLARLLAAFFSLIAR